MSKHKPYRCVLQEKISIDDNSWIYQAPNLPHFKAVDDNNLIKTIFLISNGVKQEILLTLQKNSPNRALKVGALNQFINVSFADFRLQVPEQDISNSDGLLQFKPATARESSDYLVRLLRAGVWLNDVHYNFYGHSNSQLKSRSCFLFARSTEEISKVIESLGDFSKMKTVAKKAKRIGLLFSAAEATLVLQPERCEDIDDVTVADYIFTDGCGLISLHFAKELSRMMRVMFRNRRYTPSVYQIRYRGYKGVLMLDPGMPADRWAKFRKSMKKFSGGDDLSFSVVAYSKPYCFGNLNDEVVLLLSSLGISDSVLLQKQASHFNFLQEASQNPISAFRFLAYVNRLDLAEQVLLEGLEVVQPKIAKLVNAEYDKMLNKRDDQRCRIAIPKSRLLFGVCDAWGVLKEGECAVRVTMDTDGQPYTLKNINVLVTRNPCLHPGDLQKFKAVECEELAHLVDCIVFPIKGKRPAADMMSGGDLDGDTFFVCWDPDLIPTIVSQPAEYPGGKDPVKFGPITDDDRLVYFAKYTNTSLGRVKNLYLDWAKVNGPMSPECQQLNRLFSTCVDGNRIRVPQNLESPPSLHSGDRCFILDTLHESARQIIKSRLQSTTRTDGLSFEAMELLISRDNIAISEFQLLQLTHEWCRRNKSDLTAFLHLFDLNLLTAEEKLWTLGQLPPTFQASSLVLNALNQSSLVQSVELQHFKLNYPGLRWKCVYDSGRDRLATFLDTTARISEIFHRKLIILRVNERFTIGIYIPHKVDRQRDSLVGDRVRVFAFPHSQGNDRAYRLALPTKKNYQLYCDSNIFQLFDAKRGNTWIAILRGPSNDSSYRNLTDEGKWRQARQQTLDTGVNFDCRISIALDKFSRDLQRHVGKVQRDGVLGAVRIIPSPWMAANLIKEIYVISNRDVQSMLTLDSWVDFVDTQKVLPLFDDTPKDYAVPTIKEVNWTEQPGYIERIVKNNDLPELGSLTTETQFLELFSWLHERNEMTKLSEIYGHIISEINHGSLEDSSAVLRLESLVAFLSKAPFLSATFTTLRPWTELPQGVKDLLHQSAVFMVKSVILNSITRGSLIIDPLKKILSNVKIMSINDFSGLVELLALTTRTPELALDLILDCIEPEGDRILVGETKVKQRMMQNLFGIALDHIDEATEAQSPSSFLLKLIYDGESTTGYPLTKAEVRIDAPSGTFNASDHVRLTAASVPTNDALARPYSLDALVESAEVGSVKFRCFHPLPPFLEECSWRVQNCGSFVTSLAMLDAVRALYSQNEQTYHISRQILGQEPVRSPNPDFAQIVSTKANLNESQNRAVQVCLQNPLTCLWGPPGTGKTHTIVEIIKELQLDEKRRILVTAPTHNAVDNVMRKYLDHMRNRADNTTKPPYFARVSTDIRKVSDDLKAYTCDAMMGKEIYSSHSAYNKARDKIKHCRSVFTTCIGSALGLLRGEMFDTVIIDEASQQTEPASLVPLVKGCRKAILVGDHVQLGPTVQKHAILQGFDVSLFEKLYMSKSTDLTPAHDVAKVMLDTQYRMHPSVCKFSSVEFYDGELHTGINDKDRPLPKSAFPWPQMGADSGRLLFIECSAPEDLGRKSKSNEGQVKLCEEICRLLNTPDCEDKSPNLSSIAVLTPYSAQVAKLKICTSSIPNVEVSSIDGFQGREADIVVFVTVRCNAHGEIGFLKDLRRLNVVLTRAKLGVIVVGNKATLTGGDTEEESTKVWQRLLDKVVKVDLV